MQNKSTVKQLILIESFEQLQKWTEDCDIPFTASISEWLTGVINWHHNEYPEIEIRFSKEIIPKSYRTNPYKWINKLKPRIDYSNAWANCEGNFIVVTASATDEKPVSFVKYLKHELSNSRRVIFATLQIPKSHRDQPHVLVSRLRPEFANLKVSTLKNKTIYTHDRPIQKTTTI